MALGRAFIEVHADLKPFKQGLREVEDAAKKTQKAIKDAMDEASKSGGGGGGRAGGGGRKGGRGPTIKPTVDTGDADKQISGFWNRFANLGGKAFNGVVDGFAYAIKNSDSVETAAIVVAGIVATIASPLIAAAIAGAITAGLGAAGIGAGIALALQDPKIKASAGKLGENIMDQLSRAGEVFHVPVKKAMDILAIGFNNFMPRLERMFASIAPYVDDLATGLVGFFDAMGPGLEAAFGNAGPMLEIVAEYMPIIGEAIGYFFETISSNAGAQAGLVAFFQMLGDLIVWTADAIDILSSAFGVFIMWLDSLPDALVPDGLQHDVDEMVVAMLKVPGPAAAAAGGLAGVGGAAAGVRDRAIEATASLNDFFGAQLAHMDANIRFEESIDNVAKAFKGENDNININTAKGRENVGMVNGAIKAAIAARDAEIKKTGSIAGANAAYNTQIERLRGVLLKAGLTETQVENLIGAYDDIPPEVSTEVEAPGLSSALSQAQRLNAELSRIHSDRIRRRQSDRNPNGQGTGGLAEGGVVRREQLTWIGEGNKPEAVIPLTNPKRAAAVMNEAGLSGFGGGTIVVQMVLDGKVIDERIVRTGSAQARRLQQQPRKVI